MTTQYHQASGALQDPSLKGGGMQWQLHNDTLQHHQQSFEDKNQYDQGSFLHQQRSQSASPPRSAPGKHGWNVRKVLNLYIRDYCLQQNFISAANAIAHDSGVRTDESVPLVGESSQGLLLDWFTSFWDTFASTQMQSLQSQPGGDYQQDQIQQHPTTMRRTETEPMKRSAAMMDQGSRSLSQTSPVHPGDAAAAVMQRMGFGGRSIDNLNGDERSKLLSVLKRSQVAQHQALQRMAATHQHVPLETSENRGHNGSAFQQVPNLPRNVQHEYQKQAASGNSGSQSQPEQGKKSPSTAARRRKRRSSVSMSAVTQHQQQQQQQSLLKKEQSITTAMDMPNATEMGLAPSPSIGSHAPARSPMQQSSRTFDEHVVQARRLHVGNAGQPRQQTFSTPMTISRSSDASPSSIDTAHQAQTQVASQITSQLGAQIAQMQHQLNRQDGFGGSDKLNSNQISQLKALQGKLNDSVQGAEKEWIKQQRQQSQSRHVGDMGPPPSPQYRAGFDNPPTPALTPDWGNSTTLSLHDSPTKSRYDALGISSIPMAISPEQYNVSFSQQQQQQQQQQIERSPSMTDVQYQDSLLPAVSQVGKPDTAFYDLDFTNFDWSTLGSSAV